MTRHLLAHHAADRGAGSENTRVSWFAGGGVGEGLFGALHFPIYWLEGVKLFTIEQLISGFVRFLRSNQP